MAARRTNRNQDGNGTIGSVDASDVRSAATSADNGDGRIAKSDSHSNGTGDGERAEPDNSGDSNRGIGYVEIDPEQLTERIAAGDDIRDSYGSGDRTRKRRADAGQKRGTRGRKKAEASVEPFLLMAHMWASVLLKTPEIALSQGEAKQLSDAYAVFCEHHEIPVLSEKRMSEINLIACAALIYGPRFVAINKRKKDEKINRARNVTHSADHSNTDGMGLPVQ